LYFFSSSPAILFIVMNWLYHRLSPSCTSAYDLWVSEQPQKTGWNHRDNENLTVYFPSLNFIMVFICTGYTWKD
jgi:hypothetical protein